MSRASLRLAAVVLIGALAAACSRDDQIVCDDTARYSTADSIPPVRIPDGLTPPDESQSLRLPPAVPDGASTRARDNCLEQPPPFFEEREQ